jgi:plasmid stabilization system protein ParE
MRAVWAPRAIARVAEIAEYIAKARPRAARRWVEELFGRVATLGRQPRRGRKVPELERDEIRQVMHGGYRIIYRIDPKRVVVLTVRHGRRQWDPGEVEPDG